MFPNDDPFGLGPLPNVGPPQVIPTGLPGSTGLRPPTMPFAPGLNMAMPGTANFNPQMQFMAPNGLPWATMPPMGSPEYAQYNPLIGKVNTGSVTYPDPPQDPVNDQNQLTQGGVPQPPSDSASGEDFLSTVRDTIGGIARGALDIFGTGQYLVARPAYQYLFHPETAGEVISESAQAMAAGTYNVKTPFDIITRKFEEEEDPGIVKFIGEVAFDPLTYLGIGEVGLLAKGAGKIPLAGHVLEPVVTAAGNFLLLPSHAVQKAGDIIGPILNKPATIEGPAQGLLNNYIPFHEAKDAAGKILGSFLPSDTVKSILTAVPNEYTGIPIKVLSDPINARYPKLGLPDIIKVPEVKDIKVAQAVMVSKDALVATMADYGINPGMPNASDQKFIKQMINGVYAKSPDMLKPHQRILQDLLKRPTPIGRATYDGVKRIIGGTADYDNFKGLELNRIVSLYRRGPSIADPASGISEAEAVTRVAQLMGADFTANPDIGTDISRWLQGKGDESRILRNRLGRMTPVELITEMGIRSSNLTKGEWDLGIQVERAQSTLFDTTLDAIDNQYTNLWKEGFKKFVQAPLSGMYLNFAFFTPWNVMETYLRGGMYGGGLTIRRMDNATFAMENAAVKHVPPRLLQYTPGERAAIGLAQNVERKGAGPIRMWAEINPFDRAMEHVNEIGNDWENFIQRSVWNRLLDRAIDNEHFVRGLTARSDFQAYYNAAKSPDVTQIPELAGISQALVNDVIKQSIKVVHSQDAIDSMKAAIDTGFFNREKLATIIDGEAFQDLTPSTKSMWYHGARAANTSTDFDDLITRMIDNEKAQILASPTVIVSKFEGLADEITKAGSMPGFDVTDMARALTHVHDMQSQFAGIPELIRKMEYDAIEKALHQKGNSWRRAIHDEYNQRLQDSLDKVGIQLERANAQLNQLGTKFGLQAEVDNFTQLLRADNQLTINTWAEDLAYQREFFGRMSKSRRMRAAINWEDYYAKRGAIWGEYYGQRELIRTQQVNVEATIQQKINAASVVSGGSIPSNASIAAAAGPDPAALKSAQNKVSRARGQHRRFGTEKTADNLARAEAELNDLTRPRAGLPDLGSTVDPADTQRLIDDPGLRTTKTAYLDDDGRLHPATIRRDNMPNVGDVVSSDIRGERVVTAVNPNGTFEAAQVHTVPEGDFLRDPQVIDPASEAWRIRGTNYTYEQGQYRGRGKQLPPQDLTSAQTSIEPGIDAAVNRIAAGIDNGADPEHLASSDYDSIINAARQGRTEPPTNVSRSTSGQAVSQPNPTQPIGSGSNGPSAAVGSATPDITAQLWANADSLRSRLEPEITNVVNNPAMRPEQAKYITDYIDNIKREYESLSVPNQRTLSESLEEAGKRARQTFDNAFVDYDGRTKADWLMQHIFPFWMYESRRWPFLAKTALAKPGLAAVYSAYMHETNQGYIPLGELPLQVNPLRGTVLGSINRLQEEDRPLKFTEGLQGALDAIDATLGKVGLYPGPAIAIPSNIIRGAGGASAPPGISTVLNLAHGSNLPVLSSTAGAIEQSMLPSPFRDYYTRMILASQKLEPDKVYEGALDGNEEMKAALDAAGRQADLVSVVLQQTGVLRFKTQEYSNYQEARYAAIEDATGISRTEQLELQRAGTPLNQVAQLTPEQQDKLRTIEGTKEFNQISQPLLNPAAQKLRLAQRNFYDTLDRERERITQEQAGDDRRLQDGIISGVEWRKRYQSRAGDLSSMFDSFRKLPEYDKIPVTPEQQEEARRLYNLPPYVDSPFSIALNAYYAVKPITDAVTGEVNWARFFDEREAVLARYPFLQAELDRKSREKDTVQVRDFKAASKTLRPYFEIKDQIVQRMPQLGQAAEEAQLLTNLDPIQGRVYAENNPFIQTLNKLVRYYQQQMRLARPEIDRALVRYYGASPIGYQMLKSGGGQPTGLPKL